MYDLTITANDKAAGTVYIQNIQVPYDSVGTYFDNIPLKLEAKAKPGFRFVQWEGQDLTDSSKSIINVNLTENSSIRAIFGPEADLVITEILYEVQLPIFLNISRY